MNQFKKKFISSVFWESIGRFSSLGIQFVVTLLISRFLAPNEFGLIALLTVFIAIGQIFIDSGFSQALIKKSDADEIDISSVFFFNVFFGIIVYVALYGLSPFIAELYAIPDLTLYSRILFLVIPINSLGLIQNVLLQKELKFFYLALSNILAVLLSGLVGVYMAYSNYGVWALIVQQISMNLSRTILLVIFRFWIPKLHFSLRSIRLMFPYSVNLMLHSFVNTVMKNIYTLVIGRYYNAVQVGYYNQASKFEEVSSSTIAQIIMKVSFPALAQKSGDIAAVRNIYMRIFSMTVFIVAPIMVWMIVIGESLIDLLLTEKWLPMIPLFRLLCFYGMILPLMQISYNVYKVFGQSRFLFVIDSIRHLLVILSMVLTINFSLETMLIGLIFCTYMMSMINLYYSGKILGITLVKQIANVILYYGVAISVGCFVYFVSDFGDPFYNVLFSIVLYVLLYIGTAVVFKLKILEDIKIIINQILRRK